MPTFPGFRAVVEQNGYDVPFSQVTFNREAGHLTPAWSITFPEPIPVSIDDTWTIRRGLVGSMQTLISGQHAANLSAEDGVNQYTRTVSGVGRQGTADATTDILDFCIPKTYVFVNQQWLREISPTAQLQNGIIVAGGSYNTGFTDVPPTRLYLSRLPGKEIKDDAFECFLGSWTHRSVAQKLAQMIGYRLHSNVPDIALQTVFTVASGTTWFDAIKANLTMWQPSILLDGNTIYVLDTMGSTNQIPGIKRLSLSNSMIISASLSDDSGGSKQPVDHVIVKGHVLKNSLTAPKPKCPNEPITVVEVPETELEPNKMKSWDSEIGGYFLQKYRSGRAYTGPFERGENQFQPVGLSGTRVVQHLFTDEGCDVEKLLSETADTFRDDGTLVHRVVKKFSYGGKTLEPVGQIETESALVRLPGRGENGGANLKFVEVKKKITRSDRFITGTGIRRALVTEFLEQMIIFEEDDTGVKLSPMPLLTVLRSDFARDMIDKDDKTSQKTCWMRTHEGTESLNRGDHDLLEVYRTDYDLLSDSFKFSSQTLKNPMKKPGEQSTSKSENVFRREYFDQGAGRVINGMRCYHKPTELSHEDICTDAIAEALSDRIFARRGAGNGVSVKVTTPVPIPINSCNFIVSLPSISYDLNGSTVTVPGGDYVLKGVQESISYVGGTNSNNVKLNYSMTLTLRNGF